MIEPVQRVCVCPPPERNPGEHIAECETAYRVLFFATVAETRRTLQPCTTVAPHAPHLN